jgi:cation transport regulator ChaC
MYVQSGDHKAIAEKKIMYFFEHVRSVYFLPAENHEEFSNVLARKSGNSNEETEALLSLIKIIQRSSSIPENMLMDLNKKIEKFNHLHQAII